MKYIHPDAHKSLQAIAAFGSVLWVASWALDKPLPAPIDSLALACIGTFLALPLAKDRRAGKRKPDLDENAE